MQTTASIAFNCGRKFMKFLKKLKTFLFADGRKLKSRALISLGACLTFVMTYFVAPVIEIFVANTMFRL